MGCMLARKVRKSHNAAWCRAETVGSLNSPGSW